MKYDQVEKNVKDITTPIDEDLTQTFLAYIVAEGTENSTSVPNPVGFWNIDPSSCKNTAEMWVFGLTRDSAGVADITIGASRPGFIQYNLNGK